MTLYQAVIKKVDSNKIYINIEDLGLENVPIDTVIFTGYKSSGMKPELPKEGDTLWVGFENENQHKPVLFLLGKGTINSFKKDTATITAKKIIIISEDAVNEQTTPRIEITLGAQNLQIDLIGLTQGTTSGNVLTNFLIPQVCPLTGIPIGLSNSQIIKADKL